MPTLQQYEQNVKQAAMVKDSDPSKHYEFNNKVKLGEGGFAKVFKAKRISDGKIVALKFCEPTNEAERQQIINEVGLINMVKGANIVDLYDTFNYMDRIWIFLQLMDYAMTPIIERHYQEYSEGIIKYVIWQSLIGLKRLHDKFIIHRDIKSDNILVDVKGNIKLADFGFAA